MFLSLILAAAFIQPPEGPPAAFEFKGGDRIVWIGNTLVEREQRYGYWETALLARFPDKSITVRNLGWSGDTVWGESRAGFDPPAKGFERLVSLTLELKPTVIFVCYGTNESFEGEAGLNRFKQGLEKLLDALKPANARIVLFSPPPVEEGVGLADAAARNEMLAKYGNVVMTVAVERKVRFADLHRSMKQLYDSAKCAADKYPRDKYPNVKLLYPLTDNGLHLSEKGYFATWGCFLQSLGWDFGPHYGPATEPLRKAVVEKNQLFFYRWRPQNETYLFGFRKHEQGKNAKEVAEFDPLVAKAEEEIARLRKELK
ncbi:MAG TPA: SGNH/GDSL hydrolase family protein [Gemmataceae bacterium]|nr:SGNH/GDSL hydrolase family protein [Gemmataceae bacterium]